MTRFVVIVGLYFTFTGLIQQIAELRSFAPNRQHFFQVCAYDTKEEAWTSVATQVISTEIIDFMTVNSQNKYVALHYLGKRSEPVEVAKKIKEIGARSIGR